MQGETLGIGCVAKPQFYALRQTNKATYALGGVAFLYAAMAKRQALFSRFCKLLQQLIFKVLPLRPNGDAIKAERGRN